MSDVVIDIHGITMFDSFSLKALNQLIGIALASWFKIMSEGINEFSGVFDGVNLLSSDIIDHSFGSLVEMIGNLSGFFLVGFVMEPFVPMMLVIINLLPVDGD